MTLIDTALAVLIGLGIWAGCARGFIASVADLAALIGSVACAFWGYPPVAALLGHVDAGLGVWLAPAAFVVTLLVARLALGWLLGLAIRRIPAAWHASGANRILGAVPGFANGVINAAIVALLLLALPLGAAIGERAERSPLATELAGAAGRLEQALAPIFEPALDQLARRLTVPTGPRDSVRLPFAVTRTTPRPDLEAEMLVLVNRARAEQGLGALQPDPEATVVARAHASDMFARRYFSHITPDGKDPFDRMRAAGLRFRSAGENLALARTLSMAHVGLMNSPGHRANILQRGFGRVGIGVVDGGRHGLMVTQNFRN